MTHMSLKSVYIQIDKLNIHSCLMCMNHNVPQYSLCSLIHNIHQMNMEHNSSHHPSMLCSQCMKHISFHHLNIQDNVKHWVDCECFLDNMCVPHISHMNHLNHQYNTLMHTSHIHSQIHHIHHNYQFLWGMWCSQDNIHQMNMKHNLHSHHS